MLKVGASGRGVAELTRKELQAQQKQTLKNATILDDFLQHYEGSARHKLELGDAW